MSNKRFDAAAAKGPDWIDVSNFLKELYSVHGITVVFEISAGPGLYVGCISVRVRATAPVLVGAARAWRFDYVESFPGNRVKTLEAAAYRALHKVDVQAARDLWHQKALWADAEKPQGQMLGNCEDVSEIPPNGGCSERSEAV